MALALCILAIIVSIVIGYKFKLNTGIIALGFAFIIGNLVMGMKVNSIIAYFPTTIVFWLIAIAVFFNYATENGTMAVMGKKLLYALGGNAKLIPIAVALVSAIVGGLGAGASTPAIVGPFAFVMALSAGVDPVLTCIAITFGNLVGSNNPFNGYGGVIGRNLIMDNGVAEDLALQAGIYCWINCAIITVITIAFFYIIRKGYKAQKVTVEKPPQFNEVQRKTCAIVIAAFVFMVLPPILNTWFPSPFMKALNNFCQPQVIMIIGSILFALLKLGDEKVIIRKMPISTIVMIIGVYTLIKVAAEAGLVDVIANLLTSAIPSWLVPGAIVVFAAFLSFFSSSTSTVMPLMYPLVPALAAATGLNPVALYTCVFFGGLSTSCSPFSTGGAICIAACPDNQVKEELSNKMIFAALVVPVLTFIAAEIGLFNFFHI